MEMPSHRSEDQTQISFALDTRLLKQLTDEADRHGKDRSSYIRHAIAELLRREHKMEIPVEWERSPSRTGKGGRKAKKPSQEAGTPSFTPEVGALAEGMGVQAAEEVKGKHPAASSHSGATEKPTARSAGPAPSAGSGKGKSRGPSKSGQSKQHYP